MSRRRSNVGDFKDFKDFKDLKVLNTLKTTQQVARSDAPLPLALEEILLLPPLLLLRAGDIDTFARVGILARVEHHRR